MGMKVYLSGDNIIVEKTGSPTLTIAVRFCKCTFIRSQPTTPEELLVYTSVAIVNILSSQFLEDLVGNVENQAGATIGDYLTTKKYLEGIINIGDYITLPLADNPNGQATMDNSTPVVIASDQTAVPIEISTNSTVVILLQKLIDEQKITNKLLTKIYQ